MSLRVLAAGPLATLQDLGRPGLGRYGVPTSGPMDWFAYRAANGLVDNAETAAAIEVGLSDLVLEAADELAVAVTGAGYEVYVQGRLRPLWMTLWLKRGWRLSLKKVPGGSWGYIGVAGGLQAEPVLGARATYVRGGFGGLDGGPLREGSLLTVEAGVTVGPIRQIAPEALPAYGEAVTVDVIAGPQAERFTSKGRRTFLESDYLVSATSDRMGYRLEGAPLEHVDGADIISDGMVMGSIQVPANGLPMVMMADGPTTGGYPKIATVVTADLPLVAQCGPGQGRIRFRAADVEAAQVKYRGMMVGLREQLSEPGDAPVIGW